MNQAKKLAAALLALCLMTVCALGAMAEEPLNDLLGFYQRATGQEAEPAEAPAAEPVEAPAVEGGAEGEYGFEVEEEELIPPEELIQVDDLAINESLPDEWENILLLGTDSRTGRSYTLTDTMIILSLNPATSQVKLTSLMRDLWVEIPGQGSQKLNAACFYGGPKLTIRLINEYFGMNIQYYVLVDMQCLAAIVDSVGGIRLDVSGAEASAINRLFEDDRNTHDANVYFAGNPVSPGEQVLLDGKQALGFARIRKLDSDYARSERQRLVLVTIAKQLQQQNLLALAGIVTNMLQYVETNLTFDEIMTIAATCMGANLDALDELRIPVDGTYEAGMFGTTWCIKADLAANAELLRQFIYG